MRARLVSLLVPALLAAAAGAAAQTSITAVRVPGAGPINDPLGAQWKQARAVRVVVLPQTVTLPHNDHPAIHELSVRALHNGGWVAFLIEWTDPTLSTQIVVDNFGDQVAVELPVDTKANPPSP